MPTGYTAAVQDGEITEFSEFAMSCARAFGACITMRDDPADAPIPEAFEPSSYHAKALEVAQAELAALEAMTEAEQEAAARAAYEIEARAWDEYEDKKFQSRLRYVAMLEKVQAWSAPTPGHVEFKNFMIEQLQESIDFDCHRTSSKRPEPVETKAWLAEKRASLNRDIAFCANEQAEEIERARKRTEWVQALRNSLKAVATEDQP
jgi:hypothetical protein